MVDKIDVKQGMQHILSRIDDAYLKRPKVGNLFSFWNLLSETVQNNYLS